MRGIKLWLCAKQGPYPKYYFPGHSPLNTKPSKKYSQVPQDVDRLSIMTVQLTLWFYLEDRNNPSNFKSQRKRNSKRNSPKFKFSEAEILVKESKQIRKESSSEHKLSQRFEEKEKKHLSNSLCSFLLFKLHHWTGYTEHGFRMSSEFGEETPERGWYELIQGPS